MCRPGADPSRARRSRLDAGDAQGDELAAEGVDAVLRVAEVVELGLAVLALDELARLDDAPDGPHGLRGGAPRADLALEPLHLRRERAVAASFAFAAALSLLSALGGSSLGGGVREVRAVEVPALVEGRVPSRVKDVWDGAVVVRRPLVEVVGDIERGRVRRGVLEVDDDDLRAANGREEKCAGRQSAYCSLRGERCGEALTWR